jgi:hypothetical protein
MFFDIKSSTFEEAMKAKFDCVELDYRMFFKTVEECKEAINFIDTIIVMDKLIN